MMLKFFKRVLVALVVIMALIVIVDTLFPPPIAAAVFAVIGVGVLALSIALRIAYKRRHPERAPALVTGDELIANLDEARLFLMGMICAVIWLTLGLVVMTVAIAGGRLGEPWGAIALAVWLAPGVVGDVVGFKLNRARRGRRPDLFPTFFEAFMDWPTAWVWNRQSPRAAFHRSMHLVRERP